MSSSEGTPQIFETRPVPQGRSDLDVTFHWVSKREGEKPALPGEGDRAINKADSKASEMRGPRC